MTSRPLQGRRCPGCRTSWPDAAERSSTPRSAGRSGRRWRRSPRAEALRPRRGRARWRPRLLRTRSRRGGTMRIGVLTGGGDCPGLNAVIRAVVRKGVSMYGHEFVGFRDGWRGPLEGDTVPLGVEQVRGILPRGGTILGTSRTNPYKVDGGASGSRRTCAELGVEALIAIGGEDTLGVAKRLLRRRRAGRRRAQDHRQRPGRDRLHLRLRHRGQHRDGGDRPAAHHRRVAPPGAGRRGDGPARRLDRAARRAWPAART